MLNRLYHHKNADITRKSEHHEEMNMGDSIKLGIIICDRYRTCAGANASGH